MNLPRLHPLEVQLLCSREGAAIGEGIAMLAGIVLVVTVVVLVLALVSGIVVGRRKHAVGRQVALHLLGGAAFLVAAALAIWLVATLQSSYSQHKYARLSAEIALWLDPLSAPADGQLDAALAAVLDAPAGQAPDRRAYLIAVLPGLLGHVDAALDENDRDALIGLAERLRQDNARMHLGSADANLDRLDGAIGWLLARPDLLDAIRACAGRPACVEGSFESADGWCARHLQTCKDALGPEQLDALLTLLGSEQAAYPRLQTLRARVLEAGDLGPP